MNITIKEDSVFGFQVLVNGEVILECVAEDDLKDLTIGEAIEFAKEGEII